MTLKIHLSLGILRTFPSQRIQTDISTREFCYPNNCLSREAIFSCVMARFKLLTSTLPLSLTWTALSEWVNWFNCEWIRLFSAINDPFQEILNYSLSSTYSTWEPNDHIITCEKETKPVRVGASQQGEHAKGLLGYCSGTSLTRAHIVRWLERCSPRLSCHTANESMLAS